MGSYNKKILGQIIKFRRKQLGLTQQELATKIEMSRQAFIAIEQGASAAPIERIISLNKILGLNLIDNDLILKKSGEISIDEYNVFFESASLNSLGQQLDRVANGQEKRDRCVLLPNGKLLMAVDLVEAYYEKAFLDQARTGNSIVTSEKYWTVVDKEHQGDYLAWRFKGDGMNDGTSESFPDKCLVVGKNIKTELWKTAFPLHQNKYYIIVHKDSICTIEVTKQDIANGILYTRSLNKDKTDYPDGEIKMSECYAIYSVVEKIISV